MDEWFQVTLTCLPAEREAAWGSLYRYDCIGLEEIEPGTYRAYFPFDARREELTAALRACRFVRSIEGSTLKAQNWHERWLASYRSLRVGPFLITPSWKRDLPGPGELQIVMDPRQAFGTGDHATTQLCLRQLPRLVPGRRRVMDLGAGSGILSVAACRLSPGIRPLAVDDDPEACRICRDNAALNGVALDIVCGTFDAVDRFAPDLIVANLQLDALLRLERGFHAAAPAGGALLLSGVLQEQAEELCRQFEPDFRVESLHTQEEWAAFVYVRE